MLLQSLSCTRVATARAVVVCAVLLLATPARATFSIVACTKEGNCGVAVATNNLAVGASVPYAQAHVGALVSQFETNPHYGPRGLALLARGVAPEAAIKTLLDGDGGFDGGSIDERQVGLVDARGHAATYTGAIAQQATWSGSVRGDGFAVQGTGLAGERVLDDMAARFASSRGTLAQRLMQALEAGQQAGGQSIGRLSAALLVRTDEGDWQDVDLRVDAAADPIGDLHRLLDQHDALQAVILAEHLAAKGKPDEARDAVAESLRLAHGWDRIWRRAARLAMQMGDRRSALNYLGVFVSQNATWAASEMADPLYAPLSGNPAFEARRAR